MKKLISIILLLAMILSFCGCGHRKIVNIKSENVEAIVLKTNYNIRSSSKSIKVGYADATSYWNNPTLYDIYVNKHGAKIPAVYVVYEYDDGTTYSELLFNEDLWKEPK